MMVNLQESLFFAELHDSGDPLTVHDIRAFEHDLGAVLPDEYREFLLLRNGGRFYDSVAVLLPTDEYSDELGLENVYGLLRPPDDNDDDLREELDCHRGRVQAGTLPIGDDGSNLLLLDLNPDSYGTLWLWLRDNEMSCDPADNRIPVAGSFSQLVATCRYSNIREYRFTKQDTEPFNAVACFQLDHLRELLDSGLEPNTVDADGTSLLGLACKEQNYPATVLLLERGANPNHVDERGYTPLFWAVVRGTLDSVQLLLKHGARRHLPRDPTTSILNSLYPPPRARMAKLLLEAK